MSTITKALIVVAVSFAYFHGGSRSLLGVAANADVTTTMDCGAASGGTTH
jgi:hypothetical protein